VVLGDHRCRRRSAGADVDPEVKMKFETGQIPKNSNEITATVI
jgi:hypothetical protein